MTCDTVILFSAGVYVSKLRWKLAHPNRAVFGGALPVMLHCYQWQHRSHQLRLHDRLNRIQNEGIKILQLVSRPRAPPRQILRLLQSYAVYSDAAADAGIPRDAEARAAHDGDVGV